MRRLPKKRRSGLLVGVLQPGVPLELPAIIVIGVRVDASERVPSA